MTTIQSLPSQRLLTPLELPSQEQPAAREAEAVSEPDKRVASPAASLSALDNAERKADALSDALRDGPSRVRADADRVMADAPQPAEATLEAQFDPDYLAAREQYNQRLASNLGALREDLADSAAERELASRQLEASLAGLSAADVRLDPEQAQALEVAAAEAGPTEFRQAQNILPQRQQAPSPNVENADRVAAAEDAPEETRQAQNNLPPPQQAQNPDADNPAADDPAAGDQAADPPGPKRLVAVGRTIPDAELWTRLSSSIKQIDAAYLKVYEYAVERYTAFYQEFTTKVSAKQGEWLESTGDSNKVKLKVGSFLSALDAISNAYQDEKGILYPIETSQQAKGVTEAEAKKWAKELGLPDSSVRNNGYKGYVVAIDLGPIESMINGIEKLATDVRKSHLEFADDVNTLKAKLGNDDYIATFGTKPPNEYLTGKTLDDPTVKALLDKGVNLKKVVTEQKDSLELDNAKYQSWQAGYKSQDENMKNTLQTQTQKYSNANSLYDNLVKVLSSTINACLETAKGFLQI